MNVSPAPTVSATCTDGAASRVRAVCDASAAPAPPRVIATVSTPRPQEPVEDLVCRFARVEPRRVLVAELDHARHPGDAVDPVDRGDAIPDQRGTDIRVEADRHATRDVRQELFESGGAGLQERRDRPDVHQLLASQHRRDRAAASPGRSRTARSRPVRCARSRSRCAPATTNSVRSERPDAVRWAAIRSPRTSWPSAVWSRTGHAEPSQPQGHVRRRPTHVFHDRPIRAGNHIDQRLTHHQHCGRSLLGGDSSSGEAEHIEASGRRGDGQVPSGGPDRGAEQARPRTRLPARARR